MTCQFLSRERGHKPPSFSKTGIVLYLTLVGTAERNSGSHAVPAGRRPTPPPAVDTDDRAQDVNK